MHLFELSKRAAVSLFSFHNTCWEGGVGNELKRGSDGEIVELYTARLGTDDEAKAIGFDSRNLAHISLWRLLAENEMERGVCSPSLSQRKT